MLRLNSLSSIENTLKKRAASFHKLTALTVISEIYRLSNRSSTAPSQSKIISNLPMGGIGWKIGDRNFIAPWQLEQAANIIATHSSQYNPNGYENFRDWNAIRNFFNLIHEYNNARSKEFLDEDDKLFIALAQIGSQQMVWQDGSLGLDALSRFSYMYCGDHCNRICLEKHGVSAPDFFSYGFMLVAQFFSNSLVSLPYDLSLLGGSNDTLKIVLDKFSISFTDLKSKSRSIRRTDLLGEYSKSTFREFPILRMGQGKYFCLSPSLLTLRMTSGFISEISGNDGNVRNEVGRRFEDYLNMLMVSSFPTTKILGETIYGSRKALNHTPDIRLVDNNDELKIIVECKSTRINFDSKFDIDKLRGLPDRTDEIIKGFTQIWKYVEHCSAGIASDSIAKNAVGIVATLEPWIQLNEGRFDTIIKLANVRADNMGLTAECRIKIVLASIGELESILPKCNVEEFHGLIQDAKKPEFNGYMLHTVFFNKYGKRPVKIPFDKERILSKNIWYWEKVKKYKDEKHLS